MSVFPTTSVSQVLAIQSADPVVRARSLDVIAGAYYKPVYKYARLSWKKSEEEARDITQEFFARAVEDGTFARYDPEQARFRTFVRVCLDHFISKTRRSERALKRGGGTTVLSFDFEGIERELERAGDEGVQSPDEYFDREWVRHLLGTAVDALKKRCEAGGKHAHFSIFEKVDLCADPESRPTYSEVAEALGMPVTDVNNRLAWARREFRRIVLDNLRELTATEEEFRSEARAVLGIRV